MSSKSVHRPACDSLVYGLSGIAYFGAVRSDDSHDERQPKSKFRGTTVANELHRSLRDAEASQSGRGVVRYLAALGSNELIGMLGQWKVE